jgi:hypothetical protein
MVLLYGVTCFRILSGPRIFRNKTSAVVAKLLEFFVPFGAGRPRVVARVRRPPLSLAKGARRGRLGPDSAGPLTVIARRRN